MNAFPGCCPVCVQFVESGLLIEAHYPIRCKRCGTYRISQEAIEDYAEEFLQPTTIGEKTRASLSFFISNSIRANSGNPITVLSEHFKRAKDGALKLPHPLERRKRAIRLIGDLEISPIDGPDFIGPEYINIAGTNSLLELERIFEELKSAGIASFEYTQQKIALSEKNTTNRKFIRNPVLTNSGWEKWEKISSAHAPSKIAIIAMSFGDEKLNAFVENTLKPAIETLPGYRLQRVDDEHISQAGLIDSIMREALRNAPFVIVDLTHDNFGAYWEAGYAEGLGKPVFYICEKEKWDKHKTHFDTEHSTTILWDKAGDNAEFVDRLAAAIRNTLAIL